jgi:hypothetical protein
MTLLHWSSWISQRRLTPSGRPPVPIGTFTVVVRYHDQDAPLAVILPVRPLTQRIRRGGSTSRSIVMGCGIPQGSVATCIADVADWMCSNRLQLNIDKTGLRSTPAPVAIGAVIIW